MNLVSCNGCKFSGNCDHAKHLRKSLKGYGIRTIKFACALRENIYSPGQPVIIKTWETANGEDYDEEPTMVEYQTYAIEQRGTLLFAFIAKGTPDLTHGYPFQPKGNGYIKIPLGRVRADPTREAGDVRKCDLCGNHPGVGAHCQGELSFSPRDKCLAQIIAPDAQPASESPHREYPEGFF